MDKLIEFIKGNGGSIGISQQAGLTQGLVWLVAVEWGEEAPNSPIVAGCSYGTRATFDEALAWMLKELTL